MVAIKDFEMPHSCGGCMLRESSRLGRGEILHICSALRKIGKGRRRQSVLAKYKTVRQYPTFDEWKAARAESDT